MMISLTLAALFAAGQSTAPLPPTGKWALDYEPDTCIVSRPFGTDPVTLAIEPGINMSSPEATLFVLIPSVGDKSLRRGRATIVLQPSGRRMTVDYLSAMVGDNKRGYRFFTDGAMMKDIADWTGVAITIGKTTYSLATGRMQAVTTALGACKADLLRTWGIDPELGAVPIQSPAAWFTPDAYPPDAIRAGAQGRSVLALTVSAAGKPTACRVVITSKNKSLDEESCKLAMARGRFERAPDGRDRYAVLGVRWVLPG